MPSQSSFLAIQRSWRSNLRFSNLKDPIRAATAAASKPARCLSLLSQGFPSYCTKKASEMWGDFLNVYPTAPHTLAGSKPYMQSPLSHWCTIFLALSLQQVGCNVKQHNVTASLSTKKKDLLQKTHCSQFYGDFLSKAM